jgi:ribosomal protein L24E
VSQLARIKGPTNKIRSELSKIKDSKFERAWLVQYKELVKYKHKFGHCNVPISYKTNPKLGGWVKTQRHYFKKNILSEDRIAKLNNIWFAWEMDWEAAWMIHYNELVEYKRENGDCNVSVGYIINPQLANWVKTQRAYFKKNILPEDHIAKLNQIGFTWNLTRQVPG